MKELLERASGGVGRACSADDGGGSFLFCPATGLPIPPFSGTSGSGISIGPMIVSITSDAARSPERYAPCTVAG